MENNDSPLEKMSYYEILEGIINGTISPENLKTDIRRPLVQILVLRGQEHSRIAKTLRVCDRTIRRDLVEIWKQNALYRDKDFVGRFAGGIHLRIMSIVDLLTRISHSSDSKVSEKILAAMKVIQSLSALISALQSLGILPSDHHRMIFSDDKKVRSGSDSLNREQKEDKSQKKVSPKVNEKLAKDIESLPPMERERIRHKLFNEILKDCESKTDYKDQLLNLNSPPVDQDKDDEEPGAGIGALAT